MKQINWVKNKTFTRRENGSYDSALHVKYEGVQQLPPPHTHTPGWGVIWARPVVSKP